MFLIIVCHRGRVHSCVLSLARFCGHARRGSTSTSDTGPTGRHLGPATRSSASTHTIPDTTTPKTQTSSPATPHRQCFSLRWSAPWVRHQAERRPHHHQSGELHHEGCDTPKQNSPNENRTGPFRYKTRPARVAQPHFGTKLAQHESHSPTSVQNSPNKNHAAPVPVQNSPCSPKMAHFGTFCACMANFVPLSPTRNHAG